MHIVRNYFKYKEFTIMQMKYNYFTLTIKCIILFFL